MPGHMALIPTIHGAHIAPANELMRQRDAIAMACDRIIIIYGSIGTPPTFPQVDMGEAPYRLPDPGMPNGGAPQL